jgi:hypothetical protein
LAGAGFATARMVVTNNPANPIPIVRSSSPFQPQAGHFRRAIETLADAIGIQSREHV